MWHMNKKTQAEKFREAPAKDCTFNVRLTGEQYAKLRRLGGAAWLRFQISSAKERKDA